MELTISIVTPSFNQAAFLPECLESILNQTYSATEHLVYDPGSADDSQDIVRNYPHAILIDEPDKGQSDAVSKGFLAAKGDIIGWLNSDDCYASNDVFATVIERFMQPDAPDIVYGRGAYIDDKSNHIRDAYVNESPETLPWRLHKEVGILQPTLFLRRSVIEKLGVLSEELNFGMDYEYWIRAMKAGLKFAFIPKVLAFGRYYEDNKTLGKRGESLQELCEIVKNQFGYAPIEWIRRYAEFNVENFDGILADSANRVVTNPEELDKETKRLLEAYNTSYDTLKLLRENKGKRPYNNTVNGMKKLGISLEHTFKEIPLEQKTASYCYCHTVTERRWAFKRDWRDSQLQKTQTEFEQLIAQRRKDTCIIVGNGPSLNKIDLSLLENQDVFITNYAFLNQELLSYAKYLGVVNYLVAEQGAHKFNLLEGVIKLFPYWLGYCINGGEDTFFFKSMGRPEFSKDMFANVSWRSTVSFFQMQIAYSLGYRRILMIGFDHNYTQDTSAKEGDILLCEEDDDNHFDPRYFKGKRWQAADVNNMEAMYYLAKQAFEEDNREIINCTVGGKLELFKRGRLEDYVGTASLQEELKRRISDLKDICLGKRCVIIGSDASLNDLDLSFLSYEYCLGTNVNALNLFEKYNIKQSYFIATDGLIVEQNIEQLKSSFCIKFFGDRLLTDFAASNDSLSLNTKIEDDFSTDLQAGVQLGNDSSYVAMQIAYYMGFEEVILLGCENIDIAESKYLEAVNLQFRSSQRVIKSATIERHDSLFPQQDYRELFLSQPAANNKVIYVDSSDSSIQDQSSQKITIFTVPSAFIGEQEVVQRNAILSWKLLQPQSEIILFGSAEGTAEIASELSLVHIPEMEQMGHEMLNKVKELAKYDIITYVKPSVILTSQLASVVRQTSSKLNNFLLIGRCWEISKSKAINFEVAVWEKQLEKKIADDGFLGQSNRENYYIFSRQLLDRLAVSNKNEDSIYNLALRQKYSLVDASQAAIALGQRSESANNEAEVNGIVKTSYHLKHLAIKYAPKVSVIITTCNQSARILRAVESILLQTITDCEIIVVDDGSTDNTSQLLKPYQSCLSYVYQEQQGIINARNLGLQIATGELVVFIEADEYLLRNSLDRLTKCFENSPTLDLLLSGRELESSSKHTSEPWDELPDLEEDLHIWKLWKLLKPLDDTVIVFRRSLLEYCGNFDTRLKYQVSPLDFVVRSVFFKGCKIDWLRQNTCLRHNRGEALESIDQLARDYETVLNNYLARSEIKPWMKALESSARYNNMIWLAWLMHIDGSYINRNKYLELSLSYSSLSQDEITASWQERFSKFGGEYEYGLNTTPTNKPPEWKRLVEEIFH